MALDTANAQLRRADREPIPSGWQFPAHSHPYWEFVYFLDGRAQVRLPGGILRPKPYHLMIYPAGTMHEEVMDSPTRRMVKVLGLHIFVSGSPPSNAPLMLPDPTGELRWLCERVIEKAAKSDGKPVAEAYTLAFLRTLESAWQSGVQSSGSDVIEAVLRYMQDNYSDRITIENLAHSVSLSASRFAHRFTEYAGVSPMRYLRQTRIENAKRLLLTTDVPVCEIADQVGFDDAFYFARIFREITGRSPTGFRDRPD